jgi:hypothetical protein
MKKLVFVLLLTSLLTACGGSKSGLHSHKAKRPPCTK